MPSDLLACVETLLTNIPEQELPRLMRQIRNNPKELYSALTRAISNKQCEAEANAQNVNL